MSEFLVPTELLTGVGEMDSQHGQLFLQIQQAKEALLTVADDPERGAAMLSQLADSLDAHFAWEEDVARAGGIPFAEHTREHARIASFCRAMLGEIDSGKCNIPALMVFMDRCFEAHVLHFDLKLGDDLRSAQVPEQERR
jgi:hemerythrin-like metal-binding protein